jgi:predicted nucleotidyltransferase
MDKRTINKITNYFRNELISTGIKVDGIALFGSQLKGTANKDSDLDLIIISESFKKKDIFERSHLTMKAYMNTFNKFKIPMDVLKMTPKEYEKAVNNMRYETKLI